MIRSYVDGAVDWLRRHDLLRHPGMFECLAFEVRAGVDFVYHATGSDDPSLLPEKRRLLAKFLSLDPDGAGGPAREYWTAWGVME